MEPEVLADGAALGDRFVAVLGTPDWPSATELFGAGLDAALDAVGAARGTDSTAVAGALLFEQYALRLAAPVLCALYRGDGGVSAVLDARSSQVRAQLVDGRLVRLAFTGAPGPGDVADARAALIDGNLEPAAEAVHARTRVGRRVLHGSIANAVASSLLHMSWPDPDHARFVPAAHEFLAPHLAALVTVESVGQAGRQWMYTDRATCCLAFRTTVNQEREQPYCGTCPVLPDETTRGLFTQATALYAERHQS